ncbi:MAG TPA: ribose-phosphate pyrophosphokinase [Armatimonadetes bacterium]|nr:ribose-phosphate pyrophosphokinase [Armatimonadota bacterium]
MYLPTEGYRIFAGTSNPDLAREIAEYLHTSLGQMRLERFSDGEIYAASEENVRGVDAFVVQSTCPPVNDNIMELAIIIDSLKRASAERITAVVPYYGYARQEKKDAPREPIAARLVADILATAAGADRVVTIDLHAGAIQGFFRIPTDHLTALPMFANYFLRKRLEGITVVAPDAGRVKAAEKLADYLNAPLTVVYKRRPHHQEAEVTHVVGDLEGQIPIIYEDMIATGGTLEACVEALLDHGAKPEIYIAATHPILTGPAVKRLNRREIAEVVVTNTIPVPPEKRFPRLRILSIAPLLAEAIRRIHHNESVSALFKPPMVNNEPMY